MIGNLPGANGHDTHHPVLENDPVVREHSPATEVILK